MLKNNRPYTNENGAVDEALITDCNEAEIRLVGEWIRENIRPAKSILAGRASYGLKHILQDDTGVYLTNNQFKDAMLLAGYKPVDPNELNWRYRIVLTHEINYNPSSFFRWVGQFADEASPRGDFAGDMKRDFQFPALADYGIILNYLERIGACSGAIEAFEELWRECAGKDD